MERLADKFTPLFRKSLTNNCICPGNAYNLAFPKLYEEMKIEEKREMRRNWRSPTLRHKLPLNNVLLSQETESPVPLALATPLAMVTKP
ncbi:hypothetical protein AVEN_115787-1 [Araneus ventricosus]|uniref:Uncharacterized protein n=1 Tax=Araneus ventricosus TaxID=182803 RepID=A0A4Y2MPG2_ARAVE|nr:hypothetical protein AVEN_115787-1 [Araneus ventricosus]